MTGEELRLRLRELRSEMEPSHAIRVSWFRCAEEYADKDDDISFITLWIACLLYTSPSPRDRG